MIPNPNRIAKFDKNTHKLIRNPKGGIEKIPEKIEIKEDNKLIRYTFPGWCTWRAHLEPEKIKYKNNRDNSSYYLHDSQKGFTHGCTETKSAIFNLLIEYRNKGNK